MPPTLSILQFKRPAAMNLESSLKWEVLKDCYKAFFSARDEVLKDCYKAPFFSARDEVLKDCYKSSFFSARDEVWHIAIKALSLVYVTKFSKIAT